jgi:hypothetical protein
MLSASVKPLRYVAFADTMFTKPHAFCDFGTHFDACMTCEACLFFAQGYVPGAGRGMTGQYGNKVAEEDKGGVQQDLTDSNYSEFFGYVLPRCHHAFLISFSSRLNSLTHTKLADDRYQESLFNDANYDEDDKEADAIWEAVDDT